MSSRGLSSIAATYTRWVACENVPNLRAFTDAYIQEQKIPNLCPNINLVLSTRIGSDSRNAEVFRYTPPQAPPEAIFAMKILPYTSSSSRLAVLNEIDIGSLLSGIDYYPRLYTYGRCPNVRFQKDSTISRKIRKTEAPAYYVLYEMLSFDLFQLLSTSKAMSEETLIAIFDGIFDALYDLNVVRKINHGDFHPGNIMFRCKGGALTPVIIDFGMASPKPQTNNFSGQFSDLLTLFRILKSLLENEEFLAAFENKPGVLLAIDTIYELFVYAHELKDLPKILPDLQAFKRFFNFIVTGQGQEFTQLQAQLMELQFAALGNP